ncbi:pfs [Verticillium alfalfae VaMs.102]|uniref:Pfs n=1 Tax=Verticillium alfalfae (strain VaMs.102 / ATCC MYA-4576 / FGSC 10136) TaxID=526221 RepID=C9SQV5_VERA1|nr:pfs [Verticillium alfalfae VaMs.102]EEY21230.1 pfs [Verticillium alfalfae VaMs.102]
MAAARAHIVPANGLTVLVEPEVASIETNQLSIVFVHGFTGHPERTWLQKSPYTYQKQASFGTKNVRSSRFRGILDSLKGRPENNVYWPRDLLPAIIPDARVLTYGYDTRISHPFGPQRSQSGVYAIARDFLCELEGRRQSPGRPIIFVVHSLGGIVVKELLKASSESLDERAFLKDVHDSTAGVLFFGTPHAGADPRGLAHHIVQSIARAMRISANSQVLDTLLPSSERLEELRDHFKPMAIRQNWLIYSFQEALPVQLLGKKVVEDVSSCLEIPQEIRQHIHANHMEMCRFNELEDPQFQKVKHALRRLAEAALARTRATSPGPLMESDATDLTEEQKKVLIQSLAFEQLDARQGSIKKAHDKTSERHCWDVGILQELLEAAVEHLENHSVTFFIDALDECKDSDVHDMIDFMRRVSQKAVLFGSQVRTCFSSRHYPIITLDRGIEVVLENQSGHAEDIKEYIEAKLKLGKAEKCCANYIDHVFNSIEMKNFVAKDLPVAHTTTESRLLRETCERMFPFLRYAVQHVFHHAEKAQQAGLPQNKFLRDFQFQHWLSVLNILLGRQTRRYKQSGLDCLLAEGNRPALLELVWGHTHAPKHACFVNSGAHYHYGSPLMVAVARDNRDVLRKILDMQASYCGFEDLIPDVQRECDNAPSPLVPDGREFDFQPHMRKAEGNALLATSDLFAASSTLLQIFAAVSWHYQDFSSHVDHLIRHLLSNRNSLALKVLSRSPKLRSKSGHVFKAGTPHLVEACISNHKRTVTMLLEVDAQLAMSKDDSGICTLTHACQAGYPEVIAVVLEASKSARRDSIQGGVDAPDHAEEHQACEELAELLVKHSDHDFSTSNMSALAYYATKGSDVMVEALLRSGAAADAAPWQGTDPLTCGIEGGHTGIVRILLNAGASANASSRFCQAPLAMAASLGHDTITADLLGAGAEVNHQSIDGRTALSHAAENGHHAIAIQLSQRGADARHESAYGRNALSYAAENGHETIVDLLLVEHGHEAISGADATPQHANCPQLVPTPSQQCASTELKSLLTPLHYAAGACHSGIVDRLLERGADVESRNAWSQTPLVFTAAAGHANFDVLSLAMGSTQMSSPQDTARFSPADSIGFAHASTPEMESGTVPGGDALTLEAEAIRSRRPHTLELLLLHGALIDSADHDGHTAVAWAAARGDTEMLKLLIERGASADVTDNLGRTPLMHAIRFGHAKAVAFLLHTGEAAAADPKTLVPAAGREEAEDRH